MVESVKPTGSINPEFLKPHLSTKLYRTTYHYLKHFYSEQIFDEICAEIGMPKEYLLSDDNWVSVDFGRKFAELIRTKTNDPDVYKKIGQFFFSPENINPIEHRILRTLSPFGFVRAIPKLYARANLVCSTIVRPRGLSCYDISIVAKEGTLYSDIAFSTLGIFMGCEQFYKLKDFKITLEQNVSPGDEIENFSLRMEFSAFQYFFSILWKLVMVLAVASGFGYGLYSMEHLFGKHLVPVMTTMMALLTGLLYTKWKSLSVLQNHIEGYYSKGREKNFQLYQKSQLLDRRFRESEVLRNLSAELVTAKDPSEILRLCLNSLETQFAYKKLALFLVSKKRGKLFLAESRGLNHLATKVGQVEFEFPNPNAKELFFASILESGVTARIANVEKYSEILSVHNKRLIETIGVGSMIVSPIQTQNEKYGLLSVFAEKGAVALSEGDQELIEKVCNFLALYLDNSSNFEKEANLRQIFQQYVPSVVLEQYVKLGSDVAAVEPERKQVVSVFIDLRGFTSFTEKLAPEKVIQVVSRYSNFISEIFSYHGAVIDNIVGDEVVMFFNCRGDGVEETQKCFQAIAELNTNWPSLIATMEALGVGEFKIGVGVHTGPALIGSVGGKIKRNYTAMGDTINIASRLQSLSKKFPGRLGGGNMSVLASRTVCERLWLKADFQSEILRGRKSATEFALVDEAILAQIEKAEGRWSA